MMVEELAAKNEIRALVEETISMAIAAGLPITNLRGVAFFNPERDKPLTSLNSFEKAGAATSKIANFAASLGAQASARVILQFIYQYFARVGRVAYEESVFET